MLSGDAVIQNKTIAILAEASEKGTLNDFWLVVDCESTNFRDYLRRSNTQGLVDTISVLYKNLNTRVNLNSLALFTGKDKDKAEKEAKRRAKMTKDKSETEKLDEQANCPACQKAKEKHLLAAKSCTKKISELAPRTKLRTATEALRDMHLRDAKKAACKDHSSVNEAEFANPINVVGTERSSAASTNATVHSMLPSSRSGKTYVPSPQEATKPDDENKVKVPPEYLKTLTAMAADSRKYAETFTGHRTMDRQFYLDLADMYDDLRAFMESGTVQDFKMAQIYLTSLMGHMLYEVPTEIVRFLANSGRFESLKRYVNNITPPKLGYGSAGEMDKL